MNAKEVHAMTDDQLAQQIRKSREELFNLKFQLTTGELENTTRVKEEKRSLARCLTVAKERGITVRE